MPVSTTAQTTHSTGRFEVNPVAARFLQSHGIATAADALALPGEIICGHPDRHVARVELGDRVVYLKRDHLIGVRTRLRNYWAGFGLVSRCEREAITLRRLEAAGLPAPRWLAHGTASGRAFLLVDEVAGASPLSDIAVSPPDRRLLAERLGRELADTHAAGFSTPELAAKHVLVGRHTGAITLLDWQSTPSPGLVPAEDRVRQLANLHATLTRDADRLRFLWAYRLVWRQTGHALRFGALARRVAAEAERLSRRSSVRDQRRPSGPSQRLVWLAGEAACVVPSLVDTWPTPADGPPFYGVPTAGEHHLLQDGRSAILVRFHSFDPIGRIRATLRERPWRSPAAVAARLLFHLQRFDIPGPRLLAFGQKRQGPFTAESFVLYEPSPVAEDRRSASSQLDHTPRQSQTQLLDRLHAADLVLTGPGPWILNGAVASPFAVQLCKRPSARRRRADVLRLEGHA